MKESEKMLVFDELIKEFPCLNKLKGIKENNAWHDNDDVLQHTKATVEGTSKLIKSNKLRDYFDQSFINGIKRGEILMIAAAFHDIAKPETIKIDNGITLCPGHEQLGAEQTELFLKGKFENSIVDRIVSIVRVHGVINGIISLDKTENQIKQELENFKKENEDIFLDSVILGEADTRASQLNIKNPDDFNFRISYCDKILSNFFKK